MTLTYLVRFSYCQCQEMKERSSMEGDIATKTGDAGETEAAEVPASSMELNFSIKEFSKMLHYGDPVFKAHF